MDTAYRRFRHLSRTRCLRIECKADWIIFLTTVGFTQDMAAKLMPVIGIIDIVIALLALIRPMRFVFIYAFIWALATAMMRPVVGMPIWEFVERSANWAIPLSSFLCWVGRKTLSNYLIRICYLL
ncbi:MAG: hypothetical protein H6696_08810 [Deferribacteres bacterium]|nr:hypothetical protein [Deferribacteres bacterium]